MRFSRWLALPAAATLLAGGCNGFGEAMTAHTDVVARAAGHELRVEEAAEMLASNPEIPAEPQVVQALADYWVDYILLATAAAEDTSLSAIDLEALTQPAREQAIMARLRDEVVHADTAFTDEQVEERWITEGPGAEIRARHILLRVPADATPQQRDSVEALAESLRARAESGEDFAELATEYSQDPGSAARGGDLDFFGRGRMVAPFEEAAFQLDPGEISPVVETAYGYHVIKLEERRQPELGQQRDDFRRYLIQQAQQDAEAAYLDSLAAETEVEIAPGGLDVVREIASRPELSLEGRAASRVIARYEDGEFTSGEFATFIRGQPAQTQSAFSTADDEQLSSVVEQLARREMLLNEARRRGIELTREEEEQIRRDARQGLRTVLQQAQLTGGERGEALEQRVEGLLQGFLAGQVQLVPLGPLGFALRELYPAEINDGTFSQVVEEIESTRAANPAPGPPPIDTAAGANDPRVPPPVDTSGVR